MKRWHAVLALIGVLYAMYYFYTEGDEIAGQHVVGVIPLELFVFAVVLAGILIWSTFQTHNGHK